MKPTEEQIAKLPKWAQERIRDLEREREAAVRSLNEFVDQQGPTDVWIADYPCTGEEGGPSHKRRYLATDEITFKIGRVEFEIRRTNKHSMNARRRGESLTIRARDIQIAPDAANSIEVWSEEPNR